jgi:hypothetical protein
LSCLGLQFADAIKDFSIFEQATCVDLGRSSWFAEAGGAVAGGSIGCPVSWVEVGLEDAAEDSAGEGFVSGVAKNSHGLFLILQNGLSFFIADFSAA